MDVKNEKYHPLVIIGNIPVSIGTNDTCSASVNNTLFKFPRRIFLTSSVEIRDSHGTVMSLICVN